jgi:phospholipase/carboxylesterase
VAESRNHSRRLPKNDFTKLKIFASHGTVDQVIPVDWARKPSNCGEIGINTTYKNIL